MLHREKVTYLGPTYKQATSELLPDGAQAMRVWFEYGEGLNARGQGVGDFELAGDDHHFVPAEARIEGDTVLVWSKNMARPRYVRYGWSSVVTHRLYDAAGLPLSTFSSEPQLH